MSAFSAHRGFAAAAVAVALAAGLGVVMHAGLAQRVHFDWPCSNCHLARKEVTTDNAAKLIGTQERLCGTCHRDTAETSHPSGFRPGRRLADGFPLDWKGDLTCSTCHAVHGATPGLLRTARSGRRLCESCHDARFFATMTDRGESLVRSAHLGAGLQPVADIDVFSLQCLECHAIEGSAPVVGVDPFGITRHAGGLGNHPVGSNYQEAYRYGGYRPAVLLPKQVVLPAGRVSCVSCHFGFTQNHGKLVAPQDSLCAVCHDL